MTCTGCSGRTRLTVSRQRHSDRSIDQNLLLKRQTKPKIGFDCRGWGGTPELTDDLKVQIHVPSLALRAPAHLRWREKKKMR